MSTLSCATVVCIYFPMFSHCFISLFSSIVNVSIEVEDVNDNSPEFINEPYSAVIIEVCVCNQTGNISMMNGS